MIPGSANPLLLKSAAAAGGYQIERSLRFNSSDSAYLSKSIANITTFTLSYWMKRCGSGRDDTFVTENSTGFFYYVHTDGSIRINDGTANRFISNGLYRDPSAWYHVVINNNGTTFNLYVNGVLDKSVSVNLALYSGTALIGRDRVSSPSSHANFYLADIHFIDGQTLTPSSFTEVSATTGQLIPKAYAGTYTGNSFWLKFNDNSAATATTLGKDSFLLGNNWTPNNLSVTAGAGNDSLVDTPTSYGTDTGAGGEVRGNYATLNPLDTLSGATLSNGNLDLATPTGGYGTSRGTIAVSSGKFYWEILINSVSPDTANADPIIGIWSASKTLTANWTGGTADSYGYQAATGNKVNNAIFTSYGVSFTAGSIISVALNLDAGTLVFYKNGSSQGTAFSSLSGTFVASAGDSGNSGSCSLTANFGQRPFAYTAPSGFKALCDTNLPAPLVALPNTVMDVALWTGNATARSITGLAFSPDWVWIKGRSQISNSFLFDVVRGATNRICSSQTVSEASEPNTLTAFNSDGFSLGTDAGVGACNQSGQTYVAWTWDAGSSTVTNTQGSITSQVRANVSAGFSVVGWNYPIGSPVSTIGHGLGVKPAFIIIKTRDNGSNWIIYHTSTGATKCFRFNTAAASTETDPFNNTEPTSSVFTIGAGSWWGGGNMIAYCFAPVAGYSSFGSYTGNGSADGPFVYTGFKPRWIMVKRTDSSGEPWVIHDTARDIYNGYSVELYPNTSAAEGGPYSPPIFDFLSNGFKIRNSTATAANASGGTYITAAFAENPFQYARAR